MAGAAGTPPPADGAGTEATAAADGLVTASAPTDGGAPTAHVVGGRYILSPALISAVDNALSAAAADAAVAALASGALPLRPRRQAARAVKPPWWRRGDGGGIAPPAVDGAPAVTAGAAAADEGAGVLPMAAATTAPAAAASTWPVDAVGGHPPPSHSFLFLPSTLRVLGALTVVADMQTDSLGCV